MILRFFPLPTDAPLKRPDTLRLLFRISLPIWVRRWKETERGKKRLGFALIAYKPTTDHNDHCLYWNGFFGWARIGGEYEWDAMAMDGMHDVRMTLTQDLYYYITSLFMNFSGGCEFKSFFFSNTFFLSTACCVLL